MTNYLDTISIYVKLANITTTTLEMEIYSANICCLLAGAEDGGLAIGIRGERVQRGTQCCHPTQHFPVPAFIISENPLLETCSAIKAFRWPI